MAYNKYDPAEKVFIATEGGLFLGVVIEVRTITKVGGSETRYHVEHYDATCGTAAMICAEEQLSAVNGYNPTLTAWRESIGKKANEHADKIIADLLPPPAPVTA